MDTLDLFKKLSSGTRFNKKKFTGDFKKFFHNNHKSKETEARLLEDINIDCKVEESLKVAELLVGSNENKIRACHLFGNISETTCDVPNNKKNNKNKEEKKQMTEKKLAQLEQEEVNHFRNLHQLSVIGSQVPKPIKTFQDLKDRYDIGENLIENIKKCGYSNPTPIQIQAVPTMLENRQLLACAPTGSGKTASFLIPIIHHLVEPKKQGFRAVILSPTRELAKQTFRECLRLSEGRGFHIHIINKVKMAMEQYGSKSSQKFDILITTPKRLVFLLNQDPPAIYLNNVEWLIIDEADKLFEDGNRGFRDQLEEIIRACSNEKLNCAMFSATNTPVVTKWCRKNLKRLICIAVGARNAAAETVEQELLFVGNERGKLIAFRNIIKQGILPPILVFVQSKERAQELFTELIYDGINVDVIHADRTQTQRDNVVRCFREGKIWVLICTELMSRGIDFKGVNLVINYDFPPSAISYVHRIGRTGRAGYRGKAITFFTKEDTTNLRNIAAILKASGCQVPDYMLTMKKHNKSLKKKMERVAPKRDSISTIIKKKGIKKQLKRKNNETNETESPAKKKQKKDKNKIKIIKKKTSIKTTEE